MAKAGAKGTGPAAIRGKTRIQREKSKAILDAALEVFSTFGYRGSTIDQIASQAGLSKPNVLYYFDGKEAMHSVLLSQLLETWLEPLREMSPEGDPVEEILAYVQRKLAMARDFPRESRLFANEILQGAPRVGDALTGGLRELVDEKAALMQGWIDAGRLAPVDPHHLIFSIWATTQHYADFDVQVQAVLGPRARDRFATAERHLDGLFRPALTPG